MAGSLKGARRLHERLLSNVLKLRMAWFESTPVGRLITRFSKDTEIIDTSLPALTLELVATGAAHDWTWTASYASSAFCQAWV